MNLMDVLDKKENLRKSANFSEVPAGFVQMLAMGMQSGQAQPLPEIKSQMPKMPEMNMQAPQIDMPDLAGMQSANTQAQHAQFEQDKYNKNQKDLADSGKLLSSQLGEQLQGMEPTNPIGQYLSRIKGMADSNNPALVKAGIESYQNLITKQGDNAAVGPRNHLQLQSDDQGNVFYVDTASGGEAVPVMYKGNQLRNPQYNPQAISNRVTAEQTPQIVQTTDAQGHPIFVTKGQAAGVAPQGQEQQGQPQGNPQQGQTQQPQGQPAPYNNNYGNIRPVGEKTGYQSFKTPEEGVAAIDNQVRIFGSKYGVNTLEGVINRWAPPEDNNNTAALIAEASRVTGLKPNDKIDLSNPATRAVLIGAIIKQESAKWKQPPASAPMRGQSPTEEAVSKAEALLPYKNQEEINKANVGVQAKLQEGQNANTLSIQKTQTEKQLEPFSPERVKGRTEFSKLLTEINGFYDELDKINGAHNSSKGVISNTAASFNTSELGQNLGRAIGSKDQVLRDKIATAKTTLMPLAMKATGLVSGQLNSEMELQNFLKILTDPAVDVSVAKEQIKRLENLHGVSSVGGGNEAAGNKEPPHPGYSGVEKMVGSVKYKKRKDGKWEGV
jgi:hypothetical protein